MDATPELQHTSFADPASARRNLARLAELTSTAIIDALLPVLGAVADPDAALNLFLRLIEADGRLAHILEQQPVLIYYAATVFGTSQWLGETLLKAPELLTPMARDKSLGRALARDEFAERLARFRTRHVGSPSALLARFKRREYVRVVMRDVLGIGALSEITAELSAIADVLILEALRVCDQALRNRYGPPQMLDAAGRVVEPPFTVLALGKLGGTELNYSSDVDLLYLFGDGDPAPQAAIQNREYFVRLAQDITAMLSHSTPEGAPFRIDLRLRPQGSEGELAVSLNHALEYYESRAADWELQALIKVRHAAGDRRLAREFISRVQPLVYTEKLNFAAVETAVLSRGRMSSHRRTAGRDRPALARAKAALVVRPSLAPTEHGAVDVKLDRGGLRDIEFLVQCLQRVYGGRERWLRSSGTLFSLQKLHDKGHITGRDFHELTAAYEFLRTVEHRLQLRLGQQVHQLPTDRLRLSALARGLSPRYLSQPEAAALLTRLHEHMTAVRLIYDRIIHQQQAAKADTPETEFKLRSVVPIGREASAHDILARLAHDGPYLYRLARQEFAPHTRTSVFRFLRAAFSSAESYALLLENQQSFEAALEVLTAGDFLTELLVRDPEQIATLAGIHLARAQTGDRLLEFAPEAQARSAFVDFIARLDTETEQRLRLVRRHYRSRVFASGARDILHRRAVFDSLSDTTTIAFESIAAALTLAPWPEALAVFALGRLGTNEFDILSDADLVFVRDERLDNAQAQAAVVRLIQALSAYTRDGSLFPVDARLRPHGAAGELVVTPAELQRYFEAEAQSWEALSWTKLRFVSGPPAVRDAVLSATQKLFHRFASQPHFAASLLKMRERLEHSEDKESLRTGAGALYDLDYIAGYALVRIAAPRFGGNLRDRFEWLRQASVISAADCRLLLDSAVLFRSLEHAIRLATGIAGKTLPQAGRARDAVEALARTMLPGLSGSLEASVASAREEVRRVFHRLLA